MNPLDKLYIAATGMITPVGFNTQMTLAAIKAGISAYQESPFFARNYKKIRAAYIPEDALPQVELVSAKTLAKQARYQRMLGIAQIAIAEVLAQYNEPEAVPLFLGGPEPINAQQAAIDSDFISHLAEVSGANIDVSRSRLFATGRTSVLEALALAFTYMEQTTANYVLVGGVDSFIDANVLATLEMQGRLLFSGNSDGFAPSEAAAFLLLSREPVTRIGSPNTKVMISYPGFAKESGHRYSDLPYRGEGLAAAANKALSKVDLQQVQTLFSSMNGESFSSKELGVSLLRNSGKLHEDLNIEHPADCIGDTGAAVSAILMSLAAAKNNHLSLVCSSAEQASRAAAVVQTIN